MTITLPLKLPSLANCRLHWRAMSAEKKRQKAVTGLRLTFMARDNVAGVPCVKLPAVVTITRIGPRALDSDNLASSAKYVRDEIARFYGVDDGSPLYEWRYAQRKGPYGVEITIEPGTQPGAVRMDV